jgi:hypothetical protein
MPGAGVMHGNASREQLRAMANIEVPEGRACPRDRAASAASGNVQCPKTARRPSRCRRGGGEYGGKRPGFCPHERQKKQCKDCNGSVICQHQRRKDRCKDCGGTASAITSAGRASARSAEAPASALTSARRASARSTCKECASSGLAEEEGALRLAPPQGVTTGVKQEKKSRPTTVMPASSCSVPETPPPPVRSTQARQGRPRKSSRSPTFARPTTMAPP